MYVVLWCMVVFCSVPSQLTWQMRVPLGCLSSHAEDPWIMANQCEPPARPSSAQAEAEGQFKLTRRRRSIARSSANIISSFRLPFCLTPIEPNGNMSDVEEEEEEQPHTTGPVPHPVVTDDPSISKHIHVRGLSFGSGPDMHLLSPFGNSQFNP